ncbi:MAG: exosortase [Chitinivorax sp.]
MPILLGLLAMYVPTFWDLSQGLWSKEQHFHQPIVAALALWLFQRDYKRWQHAAASSSPLSWLLILVGALSYVLGRSQAFQPLEVASLIPLLGGLIWLIGGAQALRAMWFPVLFIAFAVPLPDSLLDPILLPLKMLVSNLVEHGLYTLGYPIARDGVVLNIGPYRMFIADACSGLNSMISLAAIGSLYVFIREHPSKLQNFILLLGILPLAFSANMARVASLVLATYHGGDAVGQKVHDYAGMLEIAALMFGFVLFDSLVGLFFKRGKQ